MKQFLAIIALAGGLALCEGDQLVPDALLDGRVNILDKNLNGKGYLERDAVVKDHFRVYDKEGRLRGVLKQDVLFPGRWRFDEMY